LRERYLASRGQLDPRRLFFIDEAGSTVAMTREYARTTRGQRAHDDVPRNRGTVTTIIGALTLEGLRAVMTVDGGTSSEVFDAYVEQVLLPELQPGDVVVWDNLGAHKIKAVRERLASAGVQLKFLPPYSPDLNPIELAWSKLKTLLRSAKARTRETLDDAIVQAMSLITSGDAAGWFRHCGYVAQPS
jgi:transposase